MKMTHQSMRLVMKKMSFNIDVNLKSCMLCCREASKIMMAQEYGKIVNMSSLTWRGSPMQVFLFSIKRERRLCFYPQFRIGFRYV